MYDVDLQMITFHLCTTLFVWACNNYKISQQQVNAASVFCKWKNNLIQTSKNASKRLEIQCPFLKTSCVYVQTHNWWQSMFISPYFRVFHSLTTFPMKLCGVTWWSDGFTHDKYINKSQCPRKQVIASNLLLQNQNWWQRTEGKALLLVGFSWQYLTLI